MRGAVALAMGLAALPVAAQESHVGVDGPVLVYGPASAILPVEDVSLDPIERDAFAGFAATARYFGAFVVDAGPADTASWVWGYQTAEAAAEAAYRSCLDNAAPDARCMLYARVEPEGYAPRLGQAVVLGAEAAETFAEFEAHATPHGLHTAFAISDIASGWGWNYATADLAESGALTACESNSAIAVDSLPPTAQAAMRRGGHNLCRVIALRSP